MVFTHPRVDIFLTDPFDICFARDFDEVLGLCNVEAIEEGDKPKPLKWDCETVVNKVKDVVSGRDGRGGYCKIVNLAKEQDAVLHDDTGV